MTCKQNMTASHRVLVHRFAPFVETSKHNLTIPIVFHQKFDWIEKSEKTRKIRKCCVTEFPDGVKINENGLQIHGHPQVRIAIRSTHEASVKSDIRRATTDDQHQIDESHPNLQRKATVLARGRSQILSPACGIGQINDEPARIWHVSGRASWFPGGDETSASTPRQRSTTPKNERGRQTL